MGVGENTDLAYGPNVYDVGSRKIYNNYYFADEIFTSTLETKGNKLSLWDTEFQNQLINGDGAFIVDELVNEGYYPQLNMPDVMPAQEYIELPEVEDADLPDILSTRVLEQGTDAVKVQFSVNNPSAAQISDIKIENLEVEILSQEYSNGKSKVIAELKNPIICVSKYNVLSISTNGAFNSSYTRNYEEGERVINVDLFREIWSVNDWKAIDESPTENYSIMTDLDFINEANSISLGAIRGIINGNEHTISNINLTGNESLITTLYGTLENLYINNFKQVSTNRGGLIYSGQTGSIIDNVHLTNVDITKTGSDYVGGLNCYGYTNTIRNSSVRNIQITVEGAQSSVYAGGLAGRILNTGIENCFVVNLNIVDAKGVSSGVGGIVGIGSETNRIQNCYATGKIDSENNNVGGIAGNVNTVTLENCYSKVNISTTNNNVGGIIGSFAGSDVTTITNNLSIGNIYTTSGLDSLNRIIGDNSDTVNNNYAYEKQLLNGYESNEEKGAELLNEDKVLNLSLGNSYNYDGKEEGLLPKLYNIEGTELLPNQEDILLNDNEVAESVELEVANIEAIKPNTTEAEISIRINNPKETEITGIEIEDMTITSITRNVTQNGITSITVRATPNRYYDSYKLTGIKYKDLSEKEQTKEIEVEVKVQFYKEIYTYEDWQTIEEGTYQNYRLMADIDFSGKTNVKNNINVNRLEAENKICTLKNIELSYNTANTGLINNIKTSIKNIEFENITLTNTASSGNYFGVIASNNGEVENLRFNEITIETNGISYVGIIGGMTSGNINNIELNNINVKGKGYIGGAVGNLNISVDSTIKNITGDNITVEGTSSFVGGIFGYHYGKDINSSNISLANSYVTGKDYTGGIAGEFYRSSLTYFRVNNTEISGTSFIGGISGRLEGDTSGTYLRNYMEVKSSSITGTGRYIGGIVGYIARGSNTFWVVDKCNISVPTLTSQKIGGLAGVANFSNLDYFEVTNTEINSGGNDVGGILGSGNGDNVSSNIRYGYLSNCVVRGQSRVGGAVGTLSYGVIENIYINADIKADNNVGGVVGYMNNTNMTAARNATQIFNTIVLGTKVEATTKVGGFIGDVAKDIYRDKSFYYNNYIDTDVTGENTSTSSLIIGGRPDENPYIENTYVYKYSTLNGDYAYTSNDNIDEDQYSIRADLEQQSTYTSKVKLGTTYWNYAALQEEKYPKIKDNYLYYPELQTGVDLPTDPDITIINSLSAGDENDNDNFKNEDSISTQSLEALPSVTAYPVSAGEMNIDFSSVPEGVNFTYYVNGDEKETNELTKRTYTFKYNYVDVLEIKMTNGTDEEIITINPDDIRSGTSLAGSNNAYLLGTNLYINGELQQGEYVNIYGGYALNSSGQVLDIATKQTTSENTCEAVITELEQTAKPLHTYNYKENNIEVYGTYSTVNDNVKLQIYNVRNGELSAISSNLDMKIGNYIIDNYNDKEYQTILTSNGELIDLKERLQYPENFLSSNIKQIVQNTDAEKTEMMVLYNTGKVIVFNYVTGNVVYENDEKADEGLVNYLARSFSNIWSNYEDKQQEYAKSKELEAKLAKLPVEEAIKEATNNETVNGESNGIASGANSSIESISNSTNNTNNSRGNSISENVSSNTNTSTTTGNNYITVYNADTGEYEVYSEDEILNGEDENPVSETEKIKQNGLEGVYGYDAKEETKPQANGAIIVIVIIVVAIIALVVLRKIIVKNNSKKEKNNKKQ